jgi:hypothetical protein
MQWEITLRLYVTTLDHDDVMDCDAMPEGSMEILYLEPAPLKPNAVSLAHL